MMGYRGGEVGGGEGSCGNLLLAKKHPSIHASLKLATGYQDFNFLISLKLNP